MEGPSPSAIRLGAAARGFPRHCYEKMKKDVGEIWIGYQLCVGVGRGRDDLWRCF